MTESTHLAEDLDGFPTNAENGWFASLTVAIPSFQAHDACPPCAISLRHIPGLRLERR